LLYVDWLEERACRDAATGVRHNTNGRTTCPAS
jgi:hypothetical protein